MRAYAVYLDRMSSSALEADRLPFIMPWQQDAKDLVDPQGQPCSSFFEAVIGRRFPMRSFWIGTVNGHGLLANLHGDLIGYQQGEAILSDFPFATFL